MKTTRAGSVPLTLTVNNGGGVTGLTAVVAIRNGSSTTEWLDFADGTFKTSGWTTRQASMSEVSSGNAPGVYHYELDLAAVTLPATEHIVAEYDFSGSLSGNVSEVLELESLAELMSLYEAAIWIDTTNGSAGAVLGVNGTQANPVDNIADATTLATALGVQKFILVSGDLQISAGTWQDWIFAGQGGVVNSGRYRLDSNTPDIIGCRFEDVQVFGEFGSSSRFVDFLRCWLQQLEEIPAISTAEQCALEGACTVQDGTIDGFIMMNNCHFQVSISAGGPTIDLGGSIYKMSLSNCSGNVTFTNCTNASGGAICAMAGGQVTIDATCTAGVFTMSGCGVLVDNSTGPTVTDGFALQPIELLADHEGISGSVAQALAANINPIRLNFGVSPRRLEMYNSANDAVIQSWDATTEGGEAVATSTGAQTRRGARNL